MKDCSTIFAEPSFYDWALPLLRKKTFTLVPEEGQMLLLLSYAFPVTFFDKDILPDHTPSSQ